jgi:NADH:ubiquinone oxidoreductase subunit F (NADH-binding)
LTRIVCGQGTLDDLVLLEEVGEAVKSGSLCGLGQTAPNPVLTTLRHFRDEYEAHVVDHRCPTGRCAMTVDQE